MNRTQSIPVLLVLCGILVARTSSGQAVNVTTITPEFSASGGVSIGPDGAAYVADFGATLTANGGTTVYRVLPDGSTTIFATGFHGASGNAFDDDGNLYQSNIGGSNVSKVTPGGTVTTYASNGITAPVGVAVDSGGNVYNTNCVSPGFITKTTPSGDTSVFASSSLMSCPNGLTIDDDGNLYTANFNNGRIVKITPAGAASLLSLINSSFGNGHLTFANGRLYVCNWSGRIYELMLGGQSRVLAGTGVLGTKDGPGNEATFFRPNGISATVTGDTLFINQSTVVVTNSQLHPNVVRMITGVLSTITSARDEPDGEVKFGLFPNWPNPFSDSTTLRYSLAEASYVSLEIVDLLGRTVKTVVSGYRSAGVHDVEWILRVDGSNRVGRGLFLSRLSAGNRVEYGSLVVM